MGRRGGSVDYQGSLGTTQFGPNKARKSTYLPHSEQQQSASPDRFDGAQGDQRWVAVAGPKDNEGLQVQFGTQFRWSFYIQDTLLTMCSCAQTYV